MAKKLTVRDLRRAIGEIKDILGDSNGVVYVDGKPELVLCSYDVSQARAAQSKAKGCVSHDVTQASKAKSAAVYDVTQAKPGDYVLYKGQMVRVPELDADGNRMPDYA